MRRLGPDDAALLRELRLAALQDAPHAFASTYERECGDTAEQWRERAGRFAWFVAGASEAGDGESVEEPVGLAAGLPSFRGVPGRWDLISMWVHPDHRGRGIAGLLVVAVRVCAVADGAHELALWVADGNVAAARTYARAGFVPSGHRQPLPSNPAVGEEEWVLPLVDGRRDDGSQQQRTLAPDRGAQAGEHRLLEHEVDEAARIARTGTSPVPRGSPPGGRSTRTCLGRSVRGDRATG